MESLIFRVMEFMGATAVDFVIIMMGLSFVAMAAFLFKSQAGKIIALEALVKEHNDTHHKHRQLEARLGREALAEAVALLDNRIKGVDERYHRQDALQYGMAIAMKAMGSVDLVKQSADGSGNYALDRDIV